MVHTY